MEEKYKELLKYLYAILKPLGYRKEASDYRLFRPDGLARIVNIQRNKIIQHNVVCSPLT